MAVRADSNSSNFRTIRRPESPGALRRLPASHKPRRSNSSCPSGPIPSTQCFAAANFLARNSDTATWGRALSPKACVTKPEPTLRLLIGLLSEHAWLRRCYLGCLAGPRILRRVRLGSMVAPPPPRRSEAASQFPLAGIAVSDSDLPFARVHEV